MDKFKNITACGGDCTGCDYYIKSECEGCNANGGKCIKMWQNGCGICRCCGEHGVRFCGICEDFPCEWLKNTLVWEVDGISNLQKLGVEYREYLADLVGRVRQMEEYFDDVSVALAENKLDSETTKLKICELNKYVDNGLWLADYEADERGEIPKDVKRGVLSQDGLYNLLAEINSK